MTLALENFISKYVSEEWVVYLQKFTTEHRFLANQKIFLEGEKVKGFYFINSGKVKVVSGAGVEHERLLRLSKEGELLGHRCISVEEYRCSAIALTETEVTFIPYRVFDKLVRGNPDFAYFLIDLLSDDLKISEKLVNHLRHSEVIERIGVIICMFIDAFGYLEKNSKKLSYSLRKSEIAKFAGITNEGLAIHLGELESRNIIRHDDLDFFILDEDLLRAIDSPAMS